MIKRNILNKIIFIMSFSIIILFAKTNNVNAASVSISVATTGTVNNSITISVSGVAAQWNLQLLVDRKSNSIQ